MRTIRFNSIYRLLQASGICLVGIVTACSDDEFDSYSNSHKRISFDVVTNDTWSRAGNEGETYRQSSLSTLLLQSEDRQLYLIPDVTRTADRSASETASRGVTQTKSTISSFGVYAFNNDAADNAYYMYNVEVTKDNSWTPVKEYLWPGNGSLHINAFSPYCSEAATESDGGITALPSADPSDAPVLSYSVPSDVTAQTDIMWATPKDASTSPCQMTFNHALSAIRFITGPEMSPCTVSSITISRVAGKGVFDIETGEWSEISDTQSYTADVEMVLAAADGDSYVPENMAISDDEHTFMLIPQTLGDDATIILSIDYNGSPIEFTASLKGQIWTAGNTYTYRLSANPDIDRFVISVESPLSFNYTGGTSSYTVTSRHEKMSDGVLTTEEVPWIAEFVDADGNVTDRPSWIMSLPQSGDKSEECEATTQMVDPDFVQMSEPTRKLRQASPVGSETAPYNLSNSTGASGVENTANCYIINAPGTYSLPLVYGNAIKNGAANTAAYMPDRTNTPFVNHLGNHITNPYIYDNTGCEPYDAVLVWEGRLNMIQHVRLSADKKNIEFDITPGGIRQGNAVVGVRDKSGTIMWSWQLWITDYVLGEGLSTLTYNNKDYHIMPYNLGYVTGGDETDFASNSALVRFTQKPVDGSAGQSVTIKVEQTGKHIITPDCHSFYQWGRKDPMISGIKEWYYSDHTEIMEIETRIIDAPASGSIGNELEVEQIKAPQKFWILPMSGNPKFTYSNQWNAGTTSRKVKTIYDPSPVGFIVPGSEIMALEYLPDAAFSFRASQSNGIPAGFTVTGSSDGTTMFFPALGYRSGKSGNETTSLDGSKMTVLWTDHASADKQEANALIIENASPIKHSLLSEARLEAFGIRPVAE